jgi:hypothetical protein
MPYLEYLFPELHNIYLSRDMKSVSELYWQSAIKFNSYFKENILPRQHKDQSVNAV